MQSLLAEKQRSFSVISRPERQWEDKRLTLGTRKMRPGLPGLAGLGTHSLPYSSLPRNSEAEDWGLTEDGSVCFVIFFVLFAL